MDNFKNFAKSTLASGITSGATEVELASGEGAKFPAAPFNVVIWNKTDYPDPADDPNVEIVRVIANAVIVSGAGTAAANGIYTYRGQSSGKAYYNLVGQPDNSTLSSIRWDADNWSVINGAGDVLYYSEDAVAFPWLVSVWDIVNGDSPAPTVAANFDVLTIIRAQEGTAAVAHNTGGKTYGIIAPLTAKSLNSDLAAGTTTNDNAPSGTVGEYVESLIASGSATSLTTATAKNVTSISLPAGDWDVSGNINFVAATATVTGTQGGISAASATLPTDGSEVFSGVQVTLLSESDSVTLPRKRISVASTTTIYLVAKSTFSAGSVSAFGQINARRVR